MMTAIPTGLAGAVLSIDLGALQWNYRALAKKAGKAECGAAVKGDAYGLGLAPVCRALWDAGCRSFFVARPTEGGELREVLPQAIIYVLDGLAHGQSEYYAKNDLRPALISTEEAREWAAFGRQYGRTLPCALHVDTGINRIGFSMAELKGLLADDVLRAGLNIALLMSHFACADEPDHPLNKRQIARFAEAQALLADIPTSFSNSSGIFLSGKRPESLTRAGIAIYGGNPTPWKKNPMKPVATLAGTVMQVRSVNKGETVGYSATWKAKRDSRIAILGAGYKDGIPRHLSSRTQTGPAQVWIGGRRCPIVGRISMDMMGVDVTDVPASRVSRGAQAEIIGARVSVDEMAGWAGTICYELLTRLGSRYARVYSGAES
ncbi:MAG: alanine racemase [Proteobacteria bacterium]|nr:alanine racemase [Pseudomonadota bacterium]